MSMAEDQRPHPDTAKLKAKGERLEATNRKLREAVEDQESKTQRLNKRYEQAVIDLWNTQQELEASTQQVEELRHHRLCEDQEL